MVNWKTIAVGLGISTFIHRLYRDEMKKLSTRQRTESIITTSPAGDIEYVVTGEGQPLLISHSASGGYDQGLVTAKRFKEYRIIAPSRAGYLRTPLTTGKTPLAMANAYAALLDKLNIDDVIMVGWSAGAMSAIEFALHYPERCRALILGGAVTLSPPDYALNLLTALSLYSYSDFLSWMIGKITTKLIIPLTEDDPETREILSVFAAANPASKRLPGFKLDLEQMRRFTPRLKDITVSTLLIHGSNDMIVPLTHIQEAADAIPDAQLVVIQGGQHDCPVRYPEQVIPAVNAFLAGIAK